MIPLIQIESCESTQDEVFALLEKGKHPPFAVLAREQKSGRGRRGRSWISSPEHSLTFSLIFRTERKNLSGLSLVVGLALLESLQNSELELKWPNDLMLGNEKLGGVLIESRMHSQFSDVVIGVGLNIWPFQNYKGLGQKPNMEDLLGNLEKFFNVFEISGFQPFQKAYDEKLWRRGERVRFYTEQETKELRILGTDLNGALVTEDGGILQLKSSGEIIYDEDLVC